MTDTGELVVRRVRLRAGLRAAWLEGLWPAAGSAIGADEVRARLEDADHPEAQARWELDTEAFAPILAECGSLGSTLDERWAPLVRLFGLSPFEVDVAATLLAADLEPGLQRVFSWLMGEDGEGTPTGDLVARLFGHPRGTWLRDRGALLDWGLVARAERGLRLDPWFRERLLGVARLDDALIGRAGAVPAAPAPAAWPVEALAAEIAARIERGPVWVWIRGGLGSGRRTLARAVTDRLQMPLLAVSLAELPPIALRTASRAAVRQAWADRAALLWTNTGSWAFPHGILPPPIQLCTLDPGQAEPLIPSGWTVVRCEVPALDAAERERLWEARLPQIRGWSAADRARVLRQRVVPGELVRLERAGPSTADEALASLRASAPRVPMLGQVVDCTFDWDDLVLPASARESVEDLLHEAAHRTAFWEQPEARRLFPRGRGLLALFSGTPGTGKTMTAQVVARSLGVELYRVDLSLVVSKFVGETSKNLAELLARTAELDVVVLFDEADALFGRRTEIRDAHDRYANTDTGFLLQSIEEWPGIGILATNRKGNLDPAFLRRVRIHVEFPRPDAAARLRIWEQVLRGLAGDPAVSALAADLRALASQVELSGAQIKLAVLTAAFRARREGTPIARAHLLHGIDREMDKEGRGLSDRERRRFAGSDG